MVRHNIKMGQVAPTSAVSETGAKRPFHFAAGRFLWIALLLALFLCPTAGADEVDATWDAASSATGNWTDANWLFDPSGSGYPNNGADWFNVIIDNNSGVASTVTMNTGIGIDSLTISNSSDRLIIDSYQYLTLYDTAGHDNSGFISNFGIIELNNNGHLNISGDVNLFAGGTVTLNNSYIGGSGHFTNNANNIEGFGAIAQNTIQLTNNAMGTITANVSGQHLTIDPNGAGMSNAGTMQATGGGILTLTGSGAGGFDNTGGTIRALSGSTVNLSGASITGGTLTTIDTGVINLNGNGVLSNLTNAGTVLVSNANSGILAGAITNNGEILLNSTGANTDLMIIGVTTLAGDGTVTMGPSGYSRFYSTSAHDSQLLINGEDHTIQGAGQLGVNYFSLDNQGLITANQAGGTLSMDLRESAATRSNSGTFRAENGGTLNIHSSGVIDNTGGVIEALDASDESRVIIGSGTTIQGGTLQTTGNGVIDLESNGALADLTNTGTVRLANAKNGILAGTITNNGEILINSTGANTDLMISGETTLAGTGTVTMGPSGYSRFLATSAHDSQLLINGEDHTIQGAGQLGVNYFSLDNQGLVTANVNGGTLSMYLRSTAPTRSNSGTFRAENGGTLNIHDSGVIANTGGVIEALDASNLIIHNTTIQGGTLQTTGSGVIDLESSGALEDLTNSGTVRVANAQNGILAGTITNNGEILINSAGANTDLKISGETTLAGAGTVTMGPGGNSRFLAMSAADSQLLINSEGHTIQGAGEIGYNHFSLDNQGIVTANQTGGTLSMDLRESAATRSNSGAFRAENGGTLNIHDSGVIANTGGIIEALDASNVIIGAGTTIQGGTLDTTGTGFIDLRGYATLENLTNTGTVRVVNGQDGALAGAITNNGEILINSTGSTTELRISGAVTLAGDGAVIMGSNSTYSRLTGVSGTAGANVLTNGSDHTIQGNGRIGMNYMGLDNQGLITANQSGGSLSIDLYADNPTRVNSGTLRAQNGGTLNIHDSGVISNTGGIIEALDASNVIIGAGTTIQGGIVDTTGTGIIDLKNNGALEDLTNTGTVRVANGEGGILTGTITNNGEILINSDASTTDLTTSGIVTLAGNGVVTMGPNSTYSRLYGTTGTVDTNVLTNGHDHTIQGNGKLGMNYTGIVNDGLILANGGGTLTVDPRVQTGGLTNNGTLRVDAGSTMTITDSLNNYSAGTLTGGTYKVYGTDTDAGTMRLPSGSDITTNAATILLDGPNSNIYNANSGTTSALAGLDTNTSAGSFTIENGRDFTTAGDFSNAGTVQVGFTAGDTSTFTTAGAFDNSGTLEMRGGTFAADTGGSLTNQAGGVINGYGVVTTTILNHGLVQAMDGNLTATIDGQSGTIQIDPGAGLTLSGNSDGDYLIHNGSALNLGAYNVTVDTDYTNANFGTGNSFDHRANVTGAGEILASGDTAQAITGDVTGGGTATATMDFANVHVGDTQTFHYQVANTGTNGPDLRGAVQTAANGGNIDDNRLSGSGVTAANFGPVSTGAGTTDLAVTFTANNAGELTGQVIHIENNFDNVDTQNIAVQGAAYRYAEAVIDTPQPIELGNYRVNDSVTAKAISITNNVPDDGFSEGLNAAVGGTTGGVDAIGSFNLLAAQQTDNSSITVSINTGTAGDKSGYATINFESDGTGTSELGTTTLPSQDVSVSGAVYQVAAGSASTPVTVANQRVSGSGTAEIIIENSATGPAGYVEDLNVSVGGVGGSATGSGAISGRLAGTNDTGTGSILAGVNTGTAGAITGTVTLNYETAGAVNGVSNGLGTASSGSQIVTVNGNVFEEAQASLPASVDLGIVHIGDSNSQAITITNTLVASGYQEGLDASVNSGTNASGTGSITDLVAGSSSTGISVGMTAASAGVNTGSVALSLATNGATTSGLPTADLGDQTVSTQITGYRYAEATINNAGDFNFGSVYVGDTVEGMLSITNTAVSTDIFSEKLDAGFSGTSDGRITTSGGISLLAAGATNDTNMVIGVDTTTAGLVNGTATVSFTSNGSGTSGLGTTSIGSQDVSVIATIQGGVYRYANPVINTTQPVEYGNIRIGTGVTPTLLSITNDVPNDDFSDSLNAAAGSTTGGVTASGSFVSLGPEQTNDTSIVIGLDTSVAGNRNGQATINFNSNGEAHGAGLTPLAPQTVQVNGNVYRLADPTVNTSSITLAARVGDASPMEAVSITNTSPDVYTEGLKASIGTSSAAFTAVGDIDNLAAGQTDVGTLQVGLDTGAAGSFAGSAALTLTSTGEGTTGASDYMLTGQSVSLEGKVYQGATGDASTPVTVANQRVGGSGTAEIIIENSATGPAGYVEDLNVSVGGVDGSATGSGTISGRMAGTNNTGTGSILASVDTDTAGEKNGTVTLDYETAGAVNGVSNGLGAASSGSQDVAVTGKVYRLAQAEVSPDPVELYAREGETAEQAIVITNTALNDTYSESLGVSSAGVIGSGVTLSGTVTGLIAAGGNDNGLTVGLDTTTSGVKSGTVELGFVSDGTGTSGLTALGIEGESVDVQGSVYALASADVAPATIDFGIVHVGDTVLEQFVSVENTATGDLVDVITGGFSSVDGPFTGSGSLGGIASGVTDATSLSVGLDTGAAGDYSGQAKIALDSHNDYLTDVSLGEYMVALEGQVNNYANPIFELVSGDGLLTGGGYSYFLDFGTVNLGAGDLLASLCITNDVAGPADALWGYFTLAADDFNPMGFTTDENDPFGALDAGENTTGEMKLSLEDAVAGTYNGFINLLAWGTNDSGYKGYFDTITLNISGTVRDPGQPGPIPEPGTLVLFGIGLLAMAGRVRMRMKK